MSFFKQQGIPEALLRNRSKQEDPYSDGISRDVHGDDDGDDNRDVDGDHDADDEEDDTSQSSVSDRFEDDVLTLRNYLFISINADEVTFEMHRLVQLATRKWLEANKQLERWKQQYIRILYKELPTREYQN